MKRKKSEIVTFKADESLLEALKGVSNRSEFIRGALLAALDSNCPLCGGTGLLSPNKKRHWEGFTRDHSLEECENCHEVRLVCFNKRRKNTSKSERT
jgi:hypothetical protein